MASFFSGLLGMGEQELRFHVQRANSWTLAPLLRTFPSLSPLYSQTLSSDVPPAFVASDSSDLPHSPQPAQLFEGQSGEQTHFQSDALAFPPPRISRLESAESDPHFAASELLPGAKRKRGLLSSQSEEDLAGWKGGLSHEEEEDGQSSLSEESSSDEGEVSSSDEEELDGGFVVGGLDVLQSLQGASLSQLDGGCLAKIMSHMDLCTLPECSLVCRDWLEASSFARTCMRLQEGPQIAALPTLLARFQRIKTLVIQRPSKKDSSASAEQQSKQSAMPLKNLSMELIAQGCCHLHELRLENCSISDAGLAVVLRRCPNLQSLHLQFCEGFSGEAFRGLSCKLRMLELRGCRDLTHEGLLAAAAACCGLEGLGVISGRPNMVLVKGIEGFANS